MTNRGSRSRPEPSRSCPMPSPIRRSPCFLSCVAIVVIAVIAPAQAATQEPDLTGIGYDLGDPDAPVLVVEFGDFGCSACGRFARETWPRVLAELVETGRVRWKYVPFVLGAFPRAGDAARAGECAGAQDGFWPMHDRLYEEQGRWSRQRNPRATFVGYAESIGLDPADFERCYRENSRGARTEAANEAADAMGVRRSGTPTFFINGEIVVGAHPTDEFIAMIERAESRTRIGPGAW